MDFTALDPWEARLTSKGPLILELNKKTPGAFLKIKQQRSDLGCWWKIGNVKSMHTYIFFTKDEAILRCLHAKRYLHRTKSKAGKSEDFIAPQKPSEIIGAKSPAPWPFQHPYQHTGRMAHSSLGAFQKLGNQALHQA